MVLLAQLPPGVLCGFSAEDTPAPLIDEQFKEKAALSSAMHRVEWARRVAGDIEVRAV
jgi:hypothetical protein